MMDRQTTDALDMGFLIAGLVLGFLVAGLITLFNAPQTGKRTRQQLSQSGDILRTKIEATVPTDPVAESLAEGKAAARRRRTELGLSRS